MTQPIIYPEENIGNKFIDISFTDLWDFNSNSKGENKVKVNQWNNIKINRFCILKETIIKKERI